MIDEEYIGKKYNSWTVLSIEGTKIIGKSIRDKKKII